MAKVDLVLLHAPSVYDFRETAIMYGPVSDMVPSTPIFEMYPLGFTTMAEYLERHGFSVRIVNLAVLMLNRPRFDVERAIREMNPTAFGIDLHWLPHAHGSIEIAKICKRYHPDTPVIFGGLSATFFHEELASYPCVDYVIRGDSTEEPLRRLMAVIRGRGSPRSVPNLTYSTPDGAIVANELSWVPDDMNDICLDYSYNMRAVIRHRDMMGFVPFKDWLQYPVCASLTSRGCTHQCATCGGSAYAFRKHYGRDRIAFRDPELLVRDIANIRRYIPGPIFVLNDFLQAGREYTKAFIQGVSRLNLRNPIAFEFFKPPAEEFYEFLNAHLNDYSVELSVESHDDSVRRAFGKHHYSITDVERSVSAALRHGCSRFDLYFMSGVPTQTAQSVLDTAEYVDHLYDQVEGDPRLLAFISPMAPFLDPGSMAYDEPERYGYSLRASSLEDHRRLLLEPSWKYILNYESSSLPRSELVQSTYDAALRLNRVKARVGAVTAEVAERTEERIRAARVTMERIDDVMERVPGPLRAMSLSVLRREIDSSNESTVCEKGELVWPARARASHLLFAIALWVRQNLATIFGRGRPLLDRALDSSEV